MTDTAMRLEDVTVHPYGRQQPVIDSVNLELKDGEFVVVIGANGSGKSTLLKVLDGRCRISGGSIVSGSGQCSVATLTQDVDEATYPSLTVFENCRLACRQRASDREALRRYLDRFHPALGGKLGDLCSSLSGGQRQALALALCLMSSPGTLLLDEHTSALDPVTQRQLMAITAAEAENVNLTVMVTHDLQDAVTYGNRLLVMSEGRLVGDYTGSEKESLTLTDLFALLNNVSLQVHRDEQEHGPDDECTKRHVV